MASGSDQEEVHYDIHKMTALKKHLSRKEGNKNGVLWSQTRMRIEMRLRCFLVI